MTLHDIRSGPRAPRAARVCSDAAGSRPCDPILRVEPGNEVVVDTLDGADNQITPESVSRDLSSLDPDRQQPVTGPIAVAGALPGDLVILEVLACEPAPFGYTALRPDVGPFGDDPRLTEPFLVLWRLVDGYANSADLPGVKIAPRPFLGATTLPPGGPMTYAEVGSRLLLPVGVCDAQLYLGDSHYARGEGHVSAGIAMAATWRLRLDLRKGGAATRDRRPTRFVRDRHPIVSTRRGLTGAGPAVTTSGVRVVTNRPGPGDDIGSAAREALLGMIDYLRDEHRYSTAQACALCSVAVDLRITAASRADTHTQVTATAALPLGIFD